MVKIRFGSGIRASRSHPVPRELDPAVRRFSIPLPPSRQKSRYDESRTGIPGGNDDARRTRAISGSMNRVHARERMLANLYISSIAQPTQCTREESHPISFDKPYAEFIVTK